MRWQEHGMFSNNKIIIFVVSLALFMEALDTTIINTAIPAVSRSLSVNPIDLKIALISYLLSLAIFIPISGWMADKYGAKRVFMLAVIVFSVSSLFCGFTRYLWQLVLMRTLQGMGGAFAMPVGRLILLRTSPRREFITLMGRVVMVASIGTMLGPLFGGLIVEHFSWRWIFWINVPVGILALFLSQIGLPKMPREKVPALDKWGFILFGSGLAIFTFGLSIFSQSTVSMWIAGVIILAAILILSLYYWYARRVTHPIVNMKLFHLRTFQISMIANLIARLGFSGLPFLVPILLQVSLGYSAQISGIALAPLALGILFVKLFIIKLLRYFGYKRLLILNTILITISLWTFIIIDQNTSLYIIASLTFGFGLFISTQFTAMNSLGYSGLSATQFSGATSLISTIQQLAQSFGVATAAFLIHCFSWRSATDFLLIPRTFHQSFFVMGILTLISVLIFLRLRPEDGQEMLERESKLEAIDKS